MKSVLIADPGRSATPRLVRLLESDCGAPPMAVWPYVTAARRAGSGSNRLPDLTLVLQSWSDQYSPEQVHQIVSETLYAGLICCYEPWCSGDGRSRSIWPHSARVPIDMAESAIAREIRRMRTGHAVLPPTAARDEVFLYRNADKSARAVESSGQPVLVVSPDRPLRETWAAVLRSCGFAASDRPVHADVASVAQKPAIVLHDVDPDVIVIRESVDRYRRAFPQARIIGIGSLPTDLCGSGMRVELKGRPLLCKTDPAAGAEQLVRILAAV